MATETGIDHVAVVGAGAIGTLYAAKLAARCDVTMVARDAQAGVINRDGLHVAGLETATVRVRATSRLEEVAPRTLVVLATKVNANQAAAEAFAPALRADTTVLCVQNGLGGDAIVSAAIAGRAPAGVAVLRAVTHFGAIARGPGAIEYMVAGQTLIERHPRSAAIASLFTACGLAGRVSDTIAVDVWRKLIFNCVINPITAIAGTDVGGIADARLDPLKRLVVGECLAVARAEGITFDLDFMRALVEVFGRSRNVASMRQDLLKGRPTEIDHMNGAVVALGARRGIPCPVNAALVAIVKALEGKIASA